MYRPNCMFVPHEHILPQISDAEGQCQANVVEKSNRTEAENAGSKHIIDEKDRVSRKRPCSAGQEQFSPILFVRYPGPYTVNYEVHSTPESSRFRKVLGRNLRGRFVSHGCCRLVCQ